MIKYKFLILISSSLILFFTNNCTLIGFGVGSMIDANKSDEHYTINEELFEISPETEIQLITVANDTIVGKYINTTNDYSNDYIIEYNSKYDELKEQFFLPKINDTLSISNPMGNIYKYIFLGFDYNKIYVKSAQNGKELFIILNSKVKIKLNDDQYINQNFINNGFEYRLIPIMSKIHLENKSVSDSVFYHNIHNIQTNSTNKTKYLMIVGAAIDLFLISRIDRIDFGGSGNMWKWD